MKFTFPIKFEEDTEFTYRNW